MVAGSRSAARGACPCLHHLLHCVEAGWFALRARCKRRRNSYKLMLFYATQSMVDFLLSGLALAVYIVVWNNIRSVDEANCLADPISGWSPPVNQTELQAITLSQKAALTCPDEGKLAACDISDLKAILDACMASAVCCGLQFLICLILALCFRLFTNLPQERMQYEKATRCTSCLGGLCKKGPWIPKLLHVVEFLILLIFWSLLMSNYCRGDLAKTAACASFSSSCSYNKLKNCQFYYSHCVGEDTVDTENLLRCFTALHDPSSPGERQYFSGLMDIRLLPHADTCVRCAILEKDKDISTEDEFRLLDSTEAELWNCAEGMEGCFHTSLWSSLTCGDCKDTVEAFMAPEKFSELSGSCRRLESDAGDMASVAERRLTDEQACAWAPSNPPDYFFTSDQCEQSGSFVYRFCFLYVYLGGVCWAALTILGQSVRIMNRPEAWFFNPRAAHERKVFTLLRLVGP